MPILTAIFGYFDPNQHEEPKLSYLAALPILLGLALVTRAKKKQNDQANKTSEEDKLRDGLLEDDSSPLEDSEEYRR